MRTKNSFTPDVRQMLYSKEVDFTGLYECKNSQKRRFVFDFSSGENVIIMLKGGLSSEQGFRASTKTKTVNFVL